MIGNMTGSFRCERENWACSGSRRDGIQGREVVDQASSGPAAAMAVVGRVKP